MWKNTKKFTYPFIAFLFVLYVMVSFNQVAVNPITPEQGTVLSVTTSILDEAEVTPEELVNNYQKTMKSVVLELESLSELYRTDSAFSEYSGDLGTIEQRLLKQRVPEIYQDLHLELVSITNSLAAIPTAGSTGTSVVDIVERLEDVKDQYAWF